MSQTPNTPDHDNEELGRLRAEIERVDRDLIRLIARRAELARQVGDVKRAAGLPAVDPGREAAVLRRVTQAAREEGAPEEDVRDLFLHIIGIARRMQTPEG